MIFDGVPIQSSRAFLDSRGAPSRRGAWQTPGRDLHGQSCDDWQQNEPLQPFFCPHSPACPALDLLGTIGRRMKAGES
jgi:hypothetical protein